MVIPMEQQRDVSAFTFMLSTGTRLGKDMRFQGQVMWASRSAAGMPTPLYTKLVVVPQPSYRDRQA